MESDHRARKVAKLELGPVFLVSRAPPFFTEGPTVVSTTLPCLWRGQTSGQGCPGPFWWELTTKGANFLSSKHTSQAELPSNPCVNHHPSVPTDETESSETFLNTVEPLVPLDNHILEEGEPSSQDPKDLEELEDNEITKKRFSFQGENIDNKVSMSSTAQGSIFEKTEVLAALIAGGAVGLLFAIFLVLLLIYRMKKKDEGSYDLGKKPIYKKAPTNEFYA
ncbi:syndecan-4 isoform X1 [Gracilinanus agilis]|uniref:syndecan-4 isoform X1 n=1 Tax=Gracilinanus agilis TaxID=191870 RepID=UPI001CFEE8C4|nr:syndecan-4 isoform X1 [Gracilinanus agilis]